MTLLRATVTISSFTMASRILGFARDALMAAVLGVSGATDAFFVAFKLPNFFRRLFAEGAFSAAFIPLFSDWLIKKGADWARASAEYVFSALLLSLALLVGLFELGMPWVIKLLAPGFSDTPERYQLTVSLARITFPYILFISLTAFYSGILNTFDRYAAAAGAPIVLNIFMIAALILAFILPFEKTHMLAWGVFIAGVGQCLLLWMGTRRINMTIRLKKPTLTPEVRRVIKLTLPGAVGAGVVQINLLINLMFASILPTGAVSYLFYADRLNQLPLAVIGIAVTTALLPQLSKHIKANHMKSAFHIQNRALEFALALTLPATVALIIMAAPFVKVLFERGEFTSSDTWATAMTLAAYASGLPAYVMVRIFGIPFFARHDTATPVKAGIICVGVSIVLNILLIGPFGYVGLALSTSLSAWVNVALLVFSLKRKDWLRLSPRLHTRIPRLMLASGVMGALLWQMTNVLEAWLMGALLYKLLFLLVIISSGFLAYCIAVLLLRVFEFEEIKSALRRA